MSDESNIIVKYPLDLSGTNPSNRIPNEPHVLSPGLNRSVIPKYGAFFTETLVIIDADSGFELIPNDDYTPILYVQEASERAAKEVCGGIVVTNGSISNNVLVTYHPIGGGYASYTQVILELITTLNLDDRSISYGDLLGVPALFSPGEHLHDIGDLYGFEYVVEALAKVREAILLGDQASHDEIIAAGNDRYGAIDVLINDLRLALINTIDSHVNNVTNPHQVNADQLGLENVQNYAMATLLEAEAGTSNVKYMSPLRTVASILERLYKAGTDAEGTVKYNGQTKSDGMFYSNSVDSTNPTSDVKLKYNGHFYATKFFGDGSNLTKVPAKEITGGVNNKLNNDVYSFATDTEAADASNTKVINVVGTHKAIQANLLAAVGNVIGAVKYNGTSDAGGVFYGGTIVPTQTVLLNYGGIFASTTVKVKYGNGLTEVYSAANPPPLASNSNNGLISNSDFKELSEATSVSIASKLVKRDSFGDASFNKLTSIEFVGDLTGIADVAKNISYKWTTQAAGSYVSSNVNIYRGTIHVGDVQDVIVETDTTFSSRTDITQHTTKTGNKEWRLIGSDGVVKSHVKLFEVTEDGDEYSLFTNEIAAADFRYTSDIKLKENITDVSSDELYDRFKVPVKLFNYKDKPKADVQLGIIAQDVQKIHPLAVNVGVDGFLRVNISSYLAILTGVFTSLRSKVKSLNVRLTASERKVEELNKRISKLEKYIQ
jgi:hypothetical protein